MNLRRLPMLVVTIAALVAMVLGAGTAVVPTSAIFSTVSAPWMPAAPLPGGLTSAWFCPGVPAAGEEGRTGIVAVFNSGETALRGRLTVLRVDGEPITQDIDVPPFASRSSPSINSSIPRMPRPSSRSTAAAASSNNAPSIRRASLSRPVPMPAPELGTSRRETRSTAVSSSSCCPIPTTTRRSSTSRLATERGVRVPEQYQGFAVPAQSVRVIDVNVDHRRPDDESASAWSPLAVESSSVARKSSTRLTAPATSMSLAAPDVRDQWWFVYGEQADNVVENYYLYNPGDEDADVTPVLLGFQPPAGMEPPETIVVPDGEVVEFRMADVGALPAQLHSVVFGTEPTTPVVVERVLTRTIDTVATTSITLGATTRPDGYVANTWYVGLGPAVATPQALALYNNTTGQSVVTLQAITPQGVQNVAGLRRHRRRPRGDPLPRPQRHRGRQPADRALDDPAVRRAGPAPRTRCPRPRGRLGRPRQRLASVLGGLRSNSRSGRRTVRIPGVRPPSYRRTDGSAADRPRHRGARRCRGARVAAPATPGRADASDVRPVPDQLDRADFAWPEAPWLVAVFTSATCASCADVRSKADVLASNDVAVDIVEFPARRDVHRRYGIDAVPLLAHRRRRRRCPPALLRPGDGHRPVGGGRHGPRSAVTAWLHRDLGGRPAGYRTVRRPERELDRRPPRTGTLVAVARVGQSGGGSPG